MWELALRASSGDQEFAQSVVSNEVKVGKRKQDAEADDAKDDEFAQILLDNMDRDDAVEFQRDMKIGQKEKNVRKRRWQKMRQDGETES